MEQPKRKQLNKPCKKKSLSLDFFLEMGWCERRERDTRAFNDKMTPKMQTAILLEGWQYQTLPPPKQKMMNVKRKE